MSNTLCKVAVLGIAGRMGRMITAQLIDTPHCMVVAATGLKNMPEIGQDIGTLIGKRPLGVTVTHDTPQALTQCDVAIDFTAPKASAYHADLCAQTSCALVCGTTGLSTDQKQHLKDAAQFIPIVFDANFSIGITLLTSLVHKTAQILGSSFDIEIMESHHRYKPDAPSGTALALGKAAASGRGIDHEKNKILSRQGHTGARPQGAIGYATRRGGSIIGEHEVLFAGDKEQIILGHKATSRKVFAQGAVKAALWTQTAPKGLYKLSDILGLKALGLS